MALDFAVTFDPKGLEQQLSSRFGSGSNAQYEWSRIVFDGSIPYMPMVTGTLIKLSRAHSEPVMEYGELVYPGPYGHYLWEGILYVDPDTGSAWARAGVTKVPTGKPLEYNPEANPLAGARWTERAAADLMPVWEAQMQRMIEAGRV